MCVAQDYRRVVFEMEHQLRFTISNAEINSLLAGCTETLQLTDYCNT